MKWFYAGEIVDLLVDNYKAFSVCSLLKHFGIFHERKREVKRGS